MSVKPSAEEAALWQRRLASQANNRAWSRSEQPSRTSEEDEDMLHAAHAAMYFWNIVGNANNKAHAAQLLAHAYAILKQPNPASQYLAKSQAVFMADSAEPWERALAHAVAANVASAKGLAAEHEVHYRQATEKVAALPDAEERAILEATLRVIPTPAGLGRTSSPAAPSAMSFSMTVTSVEEESLRDAFLTPLRAYNQSKAGASNYEPLLVVLRFRASSFVRLWLLHCPVNFKVRRPNTLIVGGTVR